jgi:hypothetical protein
MGTLANYLYDDYEAKMKVTNDVINDLNFYNKLKENYVSPKKVFCFVQVIFATFKCPPYHTKFLQIFYNNLNILERDEYFIIVEELRDDLTKKNLTFHESYNNFNGKLCDILAKTPDRSVFNHSLVWPKKEAVDYFLLYVNFHRNMFQNTKLSISYIVKEVNSYPEKLGEDGIEKIVTEGTYENQRVEETYIGHMFDGKKEGKGMLIRKKKSNGEEISIYIGEFKDNKKNGLGLLREKGEQIEGSFVDDHPDGLVGIYTEKSKTYAEYKNGVLNGRCIELNKDDGTIVSKEFKNDVFLGHCSLYIPSGDFFTGKKLNDDEFEGVFYYSDGRVNVGTFGNNFKLNGEGYIYKDNKDSIFCTFVDGEITPSECYICRSSGRVSYGYCNGNGVLNGKEILTLLYTNDEYKGDLKIEDYVNGVPMGKHEYYWGDGDYEKILEDGWGFRAFNDNERVLEGKLEGGFPNGLGYFTYKGKKYSGLYKLNSERCLFVSENGKAYRCRIVHTPRFNETTATQYKAQVNN